MIKLFYKSYDYKMSLGAMRDYRAATDRCLWRDLLAVIEAWQGSAVEMDTNNPLHAAAFRIGAVCDAVPYHDAVYMFKSLIDSAGVRVDLSEIDDAMFRAGLIPSDRPDDCGEPWPLVLVALSQTINSTMISDVKKKPGDAIKAD